ncbi:bifunctional riboflavin kinase/FAD synthetase [Halanaerobaculum tunisiense]
MDILSSCKFDSPVVINLGTFDGVHLGHQKIIELAVTKANQLGGTSVLFTFKPHPLAVVGPEEAPAKLTSWPQKKEQIKKLGIDKIICQEFTTEFAQLSYQEFITSLHRQVPLAEIIVGEDFSCGQQGQGTPAKLADLGAELGFEVQAVPAVKIAGQEIGSTNIRELITAGDLAGAREQLGRNFALDCTVVSGKQRGRELGFPTANLKPVVDYALPPTGVYACRVHWAGDFYSGVVNLGLSPTFAEEKFTIEVHLFDFAADIYDKQLELEFVERIRPEKEYNTSQELITQIEQDIIEAKKILNFD